MSSSNSSEIEDQITIAFLGIMDEAMSILQAEELAAAAASSSTRRPKLCRCYVNYDREAAHFRLWHDYFDDDYVHPPSYFRQRYHMWRTLFPSIMHKLSETSPYFSKKYDTTSRIDLTALQKCTTIVCQLAYDMIADTIDEYLKLGKSTVLERVEYYYAGIIECFRAEFLCCPTVANTQRLLAKAEKCGLLGMLESIDCMYW
jgi:hypothetical protein